VLVVEVEDEVHLAQSLARRLTAEGFDEQRSCVAPARPRQP
jgi:hypothetical protein